MIDAHPEDIQVLDFKRPDGEPVMRTVADYRQLNDAAFHAGTNSGSQYEWEDTPNRLHFYIINAHRDAKGVLSYTIGVRSLDGSGPQTRGVKLAAAGKPATRGGVASCTFTLTNTGAEAATDPKLHPQDATAYLTSDIYRLAASAEGEGWKAEVPNALAAVKFGASQPTTVYATHAASAAARGTVTLRAQSESDPRKTATASCTVQR